MKCPVFLKVKEEQINLIDLSNKLPLINEKSHFPKLKEKSL